MTGWLEKFPRLKCAVLESNATWLPLVLGRSRNFLDLYAFQRGPQVADPYETFYRNSSRFPVWRVTGLAVHRGRTFRRCHDGRSDPTASQRSSSTRAR
jgi:hypothetical protein